MRPNERAEIDGQAATWIERMNRPLQDSATAAAFDRWIADDPRHVESYARMAALWQSEGLERALAASPSDLESRAPRVCASGELSYGPVSELPHSPGLASGSKRRFFGGLAAALVALALSVPLALGLLAPETRYATLRGQDRIVVLADGTTIHLGGDSELTARITPWSRTVRIKRGEAYFDVAHERIRRFTVDTGSALISVLGTAFDVNVMDGGNREVRVYRGLVSVEMGSGEWRLPAGSGLAISGTHVRSLDGVDGQYPGWIDGWIDAQDTALARLVDQLNRTSGKPVVLGDRAMGDLRVTGRFKLEARTEVLDTLAAIYDLTWREEESRIILTRSESPSD